MFNGGLLSFTWAAFQCDRDQIYDPSMAGLQDDEWNSEDEGEDDVLRNTIISYACDIGEKSQNNLFDFIPGQISDWLVSSEDGSLKLRQALDQMEIGEVIKEIYPGGSEITLNAQQDKMMTWMKLALEYKDKLLKII